MSGMSSVFVVRFDCCNKCDLSSFSFRNVLFGTKYIFEVESVTVTPRMFSNLDFEFSSCLTLLMCCSNSNDFKSGLSFLKHSEYKKRLLDSLLMNYLKKIHFPKIHHQK